MNESEGDVTQGGSAQQSGGQQSGGQQSTEQPTGQREDTASVRSGAGGGRRGSDFFGLSRRGWTVLLSGVLVVVFVLLGMFVRVPYIVLGPGPTYDTLSKEDGKPIVRITGHKSYPAKGELRMTTVSFNDEVTLFGALGAWLSGTYKLAPREAYFQPGQTEKEFRKHSQRLFRRSQSNAVLAALHVLGYPTNVFIRGVIPDTPAASKKKATFSGGEKLVAVNGMPVSSIQDVHRALEDTESGQTIEITVIPSEGTSRNGGNGAEQGDTGGKADRKTVSLTLGQQPNTDRPKPFIGVLLAERPAVSFDIDVTLDEIGGPSAGMMFALAIIDRLTPGSLTGGKDVAGTGTIDPTGEVGPIGGISFKLTAAYQAGVEVFLVPARNCAAAVETAPEELKLIRVDDLKDAVRALRDLKAGKPVPTC